MAQPDIPTHIVRKQHITQSVLQLLLERPPEFTYRVGQALELTVDKQEFRSVSEPFTLTGLPEDELLEFTVKVYPRHKGITRALSRTRIHDRLWISRPWNSFIYHGPGLFIAAGVGVTAFLGMLRHAARRCEARDHTLILADRTRNDLICADEFREMLGDRFVPVLSRDTVEGWSHGHVDRELVERHLPGNPRVYVCGPQHFCTSLVRMLRECGVAREAIISDFSVLPGDDLLL